MAWRPSGNLIAGTQRLPHRHDVVFFERNGLRHGEFTLPFAQGEVQVLELGWNCDSSILAIWISPLPTAGQEAGENPMTYLQLWTCSNYHWYLKQEYQFGTAGWEKVTVHRPRLSPQIQLGGQIRACGNHKIFHKGHRLT